MACPSCGHDYEATNQHSTCPECGKRMGTAAERSDDETLAMVVKWFEDWELATREAREQSERDRDYYDGMQWTAEEKEDLDARDQPAIVKNRIFKKINFLLGTEVKNRADPKALPRTPAHDDDTEAVTDALRYVCDVNDFDQVSSEVWADVLIQGYGGAIIEVERVGDQVEIRDRHVPWDRLWYDLHSRKRDFSDAQHNGAAQWMYVDDAIAHYADRADAVDNVEDILRATLDHAGSGVVDGTHEDKPQGVWVSVEGRSKRIRVSECYYLRTDPETKRRTWYTCHYTAAGFLVRPKPTGHHDELGNDVNPLVMESAFVTRQGMRYGLVRHMIGPQDEINKRSSKALHWMTVDRMVAEEGAVLDVHEARTERSKPDGLVIVQPGALKDQRVIFEKGLDMAQGQIALLQEAKQEIDSVGPEIPQIGSMSADASGRAIQARQQIGSLELAPLDDGHKRWKRACYRQKWYRVRQYWPGEKWMRVRDDAERKGFRFVGLNRKMTRGQRFQELMQKEVPMEGAAQAVLGNQAAVVLPKVMQQHQMLMQRQAMMQQQQAAMQAKATGKPPPPPPHVPPEQHQAMVTQLLLQHPLMAEEMTAADVAGLDVDIVLDETPDVTILQQEESEQLNSLIPVFLNVKPDMADTLLEMAIEVSQLRSKRKLLEMMRKAPDPKAMQMQEMMQKLQMAAAQAEVELTKSETAENQAQAAKAQADAQAAPLKAQAEVQAKQAAAMVDAASAGEKAAGSGPQRPA